MKQIFCSISAAPGANTTYGNPMHTDDWVASTVESNVHCPVAAAGTLRNLCVRVNTASGTQVFTVRKNGTDTGLTVSIVSPAVEATISGVDVSVAAGDLISISRVPTGSTGSITRVAIEFESSTTVASINPTSVSAGVAAVGERWNGLLHGKTQWDTPDDHSTRNVAAIAGTITKLYAVVATAPGVGESYILAAVKNGTLQDGAGGTVDTRVTIADAATAANASFSLTVAAGDTLSIKCVRSAAAASTRIAYCVAFDATTAGSSNFCGRSSSTLSITDTQYNNPSFGGGTRAWTTTEVDHELWTGLSPFQLASMRVALSVAPGTGDSYTFSGRVNAASPSGATSVTIADSATTGAGTGTLDVAAGDEFSIRSVPAGTPTGSAVSWAFGMSGVGETDFGQKRGVFVAGVDTTVTATRAAAFGLDGNTNTHSEAGVLKVFGEIHATDDIKSTNAAKGTGSTVGQQVTVGRNSSGNGAAGCLVLYNKSGTPYYLWVEGGELLIHTAAPTEDNTTVSHTAGTVVGTQT